MKDNKSELRDISLQCEKSSSAHLDQLVFWVHLLAALVGKMGRKRQQIPYKLLWLLFIKMIFLSCRLWDKSNSNSWGPLIHRIGTNTVSRTKSISPLNNMYSPYEQERWSVTLKPAREMLEILYQNRVSTWLISLKLNGFQTSKYQDWDCHHLQKQWNYIYYP